MSFAKALIEQGFPVGSVFGEGLGAQPMPHPDGRSLLPLFENPQRKDWPDQILNAYYGGEFSVYSGWR